MAQFLYRLKPTRLEMVISGATERESEIIGRHFNYLQDLLEKGVAIVFGRTDNRDEDIFGIVIFNADSEEAARQIMENDPAVKEGVMHAKLFPYRLAMIREANVVVPADT